MVLDAPGVNEVVGRPRAVEPPRPRQALDEAAAFYGQRTFQDGILPGQPGQQRQQEGIGLAGSGAAPAEDVAAGYGFRYGAVFRRLIARP